MWKLFPLLFIWLWRRFNNRQGAYKMFIVSAKSLHAVFTKHNLFGGSQVPLRWRHDVISWDAEQEGHYFLFTSVKEKEKNKIKSGSNETLIQQGCRLSYRVFGLTEQLRGSWKLEGQMLIHGGRDEAAPGKWLVAAAVQQSHAVPFIGSLDICTTTAHILLEFCGWECIDKCPTERAWTRTWIQISWGAFLKIYF